MLLSQKEKKTKSKTIKNSSSNKKQKVAKPPTEPTESTEPTDSTQPAEDTLDQRVVESDNLATTPHINQLESTQPVDYSSNKDIFIEIEEVDKNRMTQDILTRLLYAQDETELERYILGIIAEPNTTEQGHPGVIYDMVKHEIGDKALSALHTIQYCNSIPGFSDNAFLRRLQYHYILFATLALNEGFVQFVTLKTHRPQQLLSFITNTLRPLLVEFMEGNMTDNQNRVLLEPKYADNQLYKFVSKCRLSYLMQCMPLTLD